jgi:hypothetical protein
LELITPIIKSFKKYCRYNGFFLLKHFNLPTKAKKRSGLVYCPCKYV